MQGACVPIPFTVHCITCIIYFEDVTGLIGRSTFHAGLCYIAKPVVNVRRDSCLSS